MADLNKEPEEGRKGGSLESGMALPRYYEPTVTAVTDMVVPATRIQWGPVFAGLVVALSFSLLFTSLGVAVGIGALGLGFWAVAFATVGLFLGSYLTSRTAKAEFVPAIVHSVVLWGIVLILSTVGIGRIGGAFLAGIPSGTAAATAGLGWWFFIGFIIMLAGSVFGGILGMSHEVRHDEPHL